MPRVPYDSNQTAVVNHTDFLTYKTTITTTNNDMKKLIIAFFGRSLYVYVFKYFDKNKTSSSLHEKL